MLTVHEVSGLTGVSIRTLHYYDEIGLLKPAAVTEAGYRLYGEKELERLQQIMLYRELEFPPDEIRRILGTPDFDREKALRQQEELLTLKKERLEKLILLAKELQKGGNDMSFKAFDKEKIDRYAEQAKQAWGKTAAYREYEQKTAGQTDRQQAELAAEMMELFARLGTMRDRTPDDADVQAWTKELQAFITTHYYSCTEPILASLGAMYAAGGEMTENIDRAGGPGTAKLASEAIAVRCAR